MDSAYQEKPPGLCVPIHLSITKQMMMAGVPRGIAIINWTFCLALSLPLHTWYAIPLSFFIHVVCREAAKRDPDFWDVFRRSIRYKTFYRV